MITLYVEDTRQFPSAETYTEMVRQAIETTYLSDEDIKKLDIITPIRHNVVGRKYNANLPVL
jgi:hypothetical protein